MSGAGTKNSSSHNEEEASLPQYTEPKNIDNAVRLIHESQQRILHASDMNIARNELGTSNLDYAEADNKMLEQAKKLQKRFSK